MPTSFSRLFPLVSGPPLGPLWTPADLAVAPYAWYDASDAATLTLSGSNVVSIADKSGNSRLPLLGSAVNPTYGATVFPGGLPGVATSSTAALRTSVASDFGLRGPNFALFMEYAHNNPNSGFYTRLLSLHPNPAAGGGDYGGPTGANLFWFPPDFAYDWNNINSPGYTVPVNTATSLSIVGGTASHSIYWDGGSPFTIAQPAPLIVGSMGVMQGPTTDAYENMPAGFFAEAVPLGYTPTTDERQRIEGYLAWKWGSVARLPSDHPYKSAPPRTQSTAVDGYAAGQTLPATASLIRGAASGQRQPTASGQTLPFNTLLVGGNASGQSNASAAGEILPATASLVPGTASGETGSQNGTANGVLLTATASLLAGAATGGGRRSGPVYYIIDDYEEEAPRAKPKPRKKAPVKAPTKKKRTRIPEAVIEDAIEALPFWARLFVEEDRALPETYQVPVAATENRQALVDWLAEYMLMVAMEDAEEEDLLLLTA